jgi:hypothetical protein
MRLACWCTVQVLRPNASTMFFVLESARPRPPLFYRSTAFPTLGQNTLLNRLSLGSRLGSRSCRDAPGTPSTGRRDGAPCGGKASSVPFAGVAAGWSRLSAKADQRRLDAGTAFQLLARPPYRPLQPAHVLRHQVGGVRLRRSCVPKQLLAAAPPGAKLRTDPLERFLNTLRS